MLARRDGFLDEPVQAAEDLGLRQVAEHPPAQNASDASDVVRRDAAADVAHQLRPEQPGVDAEKWADPALDVRVRGACLLQSERRFAKLEALAEAAELCRPDVVQSGAQSCAAQEAAAVRSDAAAQLVVRQMPWAGALQMAELQPLPAAELARDAR